MGLRHIAVPVPHGNLRLGQEVVQARELIVDQRLQRADVERADRRRRVLPEERQDRKEGCLRLAGRGLGTEKKVLVGIEDGIRRRGLDGAERLPVVPVNVVLDKRGVAVKDIHDCLGSGAGRGNGDKSPRMRGNVDKAATLQRKGGKVLRGGARCGSCGMDRRRDLLQKCVPALRERVLRVLKFV